jgi:hypothetical protein
MVAVTAHVTAKLDVKTPALIAQLAGSPLTNE